MKREIKFRAWDKSHKTMFYPDDISHITFGHYDWDMIYTATGTPASFGKKYPDEMEIMQFTGLKDKNGKEIYEGDIVKIPEGYGGDTNYHEIIAPIIYEEAEFTPDNRYGKYGNKWGLVMQDWNWDEVEIIGNIYENPELL